MRQTILTENYSETAPREQENVSWYGPEEYSSKKHSLLTIRNLVCCTLAILSDSATCS